MSSSSELLKRRQILLTRLSGLKAALCQTTVEPSVLTWQTLAILHARLRAELAELDSMIEFAESQSARDASLPYD